MPSQVQFENKRITVAAFEYLKRSCLERLKNLSSSTSSPIPISTLFHFITRIIRTSSPCTTLHAKGAQEPRGALEQRENAARILFHRTMETRRSWLKHGTMPTVFFPTSNLCIFYRAKCTTGIETSRRPIYSRATDNRSPPIWPPAGH